MKSNCFGVEEEKYPEFFKKYCTPKGELHWDLLMTNVTPFTPEQEAWRRDWSRRHDEWERKKKEMRERGGHGNDNLNESTGGDKAA